MRTNAHRFTCDEPDCWQIACDICGQSMAEAGEVGELIAKLADYPLQSALYAASNGRPLGYSERVALGRLHDLVQQTLRIVEKAEREGVRS